MLTLGHLKFWTPEFFMTASVFEQSLLASCIITLIVIPSVYFIAHSEYLFPNDTPRPVDTFRLEEGLPTQVELTPEDFQNHPQLKEIFDLKDEDVNGNVNLALESQEHFEKLLNEESIWFFILDAVYRYFFS